MRRKWLRSGALLMALLLTHEFAGAALAWSDTVGGAFSPGPYALLGVGLALLFVAVRLTLWLVVLPAALAMLASWLWDLAMKRHSEARLRAEPQR